MNIIFDNIIFSLQKAGGISVYWSEILKYFTPFKNHNISIINYSNDNIFAKSLNFENTRIIKTRNLPLKYERYINPKRINPNDKSIFHSSYYRIMKGKNILNIVTVHDFTYEKKLTSLKRFVHIHQKKKSLFNADGIICISNNTKSDMLEIYPQLKKKMISVIYNSYDEINFFNIKNSNYEDNQVLFVGGRNGYKNFKLAVDSVSLSNDLFLNIVGSDLTSKEIEFLNLKLGKNRYKLYKYLSPKELNELYNKNLCLLYLSEYEGFGIPILEAMSAGCPVIVSNNSSIPEVAGAAGIYIKLDPQDVLEKINQIRLDNVFRQNIVIKGLNNVKKFSWLESAKQVELFYSRILNS